MTNNPLLTESSLPYHLPPFALVKDEHFAPAFESGMAEHLEETAAIVNNPGAPTFDNTVVALERAGQLLSRVNRVFGILCGTMTNLALQKLESAVSPKLAAHSDAVSLNAALFARIALLHDKREQLGLDAESKRLLERYYKDFVRSGAKLGDTEKPQLRTINTELATLTTRFSQNVLKEINASTVIVDRREDLAGLSDAAINAAAASAKAAGLDGKFAIALTNTTAQPPLSSIENRTLRERVMAASLVRGSRGSEFDNRAAVVDIARLRGERAALLGYPSHAAYQLDDQTIGTVDQVNTLLAQLAGPAVMNARREASDMQAIIDAERGGFTLSMADWNFYAEKVRKSRYDFDESELKPYYELRRVLVDGVFYAAQRFYGLTFRERDDLRGYSPDMFVFEVFNEDSTPLALFLGDYYARASKRGGAWASAYVPQSDLLDRRPVVGNHLNIPKPPAGEPTLLTRFEVVTMFHEFGHALHQMFSAVKYPRFSGTSVPRDFVELPSQLNEMWADWPEVLKNYAKHYKTGAPIAQALLDKLDNASKFNQGYSTTSLVAANVIDQAWYQLAPGELPTAEGVTEFEAAALEKAGVDFAPVPPRYRSTYFSHVFSGGYSAGYYSYFWSEVLAANMVDWIKSHGGLTRANGDRLRALLLSRGGTADAMMMFRELTGSEPDIAPLLTRRGLEVHACGVSGR